MTPAAAYKDYVHHLKKALDILGASEDYPQELGERARVTAKVIRDELKTVDAVLCTLAMHEFIDGLNEDWNDATT
jgi:hypothetical protein